MSVNYTVTHLKKDWLCITTEIKGKATCKLEPKIQLNSLNFYELWLNDLAEHQHFEARPLSSLGLFDRAA